MNKGSDETGRNETRFLVSRKPDVLSLNPFPE
jgi:hypothetical protein